MRKVFSSDGNQSMRGPKIVMFRRRNLAKGAAAGAISGLAGTIVMTQFQNAWQKTSESLKSRSSSSADNNGTANAERSSSRANSGNEENENPTVKVAQTLASAGRKSLSDDQKKKGGSLVHYGFGTLMGAAYGITMELRARGKRGSAYPHGLTFGTALFAGADELALPVLKLSKAPTKVPVSQHLYGFASHLVYGATAAAVFRAVRKAM